MKRFVALMGAFVLCSSSSVFAASCNTPVVSNGRTVCLSNFVNQCSQNNNNAVRTLTRNNACNVQGVAQRTAIPKVAGVNSSNCNVKTLTINNRVATNNCAANPASCTTNKCAVNPASCAANPASCPANNKANNNNSNNCANGKCETTTKATEKQTNNCPSGNCETTTKTTTEKTTEATTAKTNNNANTSVNANSSMEEQVVALVNKERAANGLSPLKINKELSNVAQLKSEDMKAKNYFDHNSPTYGSPFDMLKQFNVSYSYAGENIARGQKTAEDVMQAWMNSEGHRKNILSPNFSEIGVGYATGGNGPYWTQTFIK